MVVSRTNPGLATSSESGVRDTDTGSRTPPTVTPAQPPAGAPGSAPGRRGPPVANRSLQNVLMGAAVRLPSPPRLSHASSRDGESAAALEKLESEKWLASGRAEELSAHDAQYRQLELMHQDLFGSTEISCLEEPQAGQFGRVCDVDMDEHAVIKLGRSPYDCIGTTGLATCIALCARGEDAAGCKVLGLMHFSGIEDPEDAMQTLQDEMTNAGALDTRFYLVGGMMTPDDPAGGTYESEAAFLALRSDFPIAGAKLHLNVGERDDQGGFNGVNLVMSADNIYYSKKELY